jgi:hypothetical protein
VMIARHRGEDRLHRRGRPAATTGAGSERGDPELVEPLDADLIAPEPLDPPAAGSRRLPALISVAAVIVIAAIATHHNRSAQSGALPSTPRQWVQQWTAASLENPALVCQHLFASALAAAFKADTGRSCRTYYGSVRSSSFHIRHVLEDGPTAAVEAQQLGHGRTWGYFTLVLSKVHGGWRAVDVVPGASVRPR